MRSLKPLACALLLLTGCAASNGPVVDNAKNPPATPLAKPEAGKGFQIYMAPFEIAPEEEKEVFIYKNSPITERQFINKVEFSMREGSHHFVLYTLNGAMEGLTDGQVRTNIEQEMQRQTRSFVFGAHHEQTTYNFPPGVAMVMEPGQGLDLNAHYVNPTNELYKGEAYINLYTVPQSEVEHVAIPKLDVDTKFSIPPHSTYTRKYNWGAFGKRTHLFLLTSHAHKRMLSFKIFKIHSGDTTQIYETRNWHEPDVSAEDIIFEPNDMIYSETTWRNESDQAVRFGFSAEDEMNVIYGYYWQ
jgi:hypothetical protein